MVVEGGVGSILGEANLDGSLVANEIIGYKIVEGCNVMVVKVDMMKYSVMCRDLASMNASKDGFW